MAQELRGEIWGKKRGLYEKCFKERNRFPEQEPKEISREKLENIMYLSSYGLRGLRSWGLLGECGKQRISMKNYRAKTWEMRIVVVGLGLLVSEIIKYKRHSDISLGELQ